VLRLARSSAKRDRTRALNQKRALVTTAPDELRTQLRALTIPRLVRAAAGFRPAGRTNVTNATRVALKTLARRVLELDDEIVISTTTRPPGLSGFRAGPQLFDQLRVAPAGRRDGWDASWTSATPGRNCLSRDNDATLPRSRHGGTPSPACHQRNVGSSCGS
jgi:hypothetical protein